MAIYQLAGPQALAYKDEAGDNGFITVSQPEPSPLAFTVTYDGATRQFLIWMEAYRDGAGVEHDGITIKLPLDAPGFQSYSDSGHLNFGGASAFFHDNQIKVAVLHFRGERPKGGPNDNTRDLYIWRSGVYLVEV